MMKSPEDIPKSGILTVRTTVEGSEETATLIDTGASHSHISEHFFYSLNPRPELHRDKRLEKKFLTANGHALQTIGYVDVEVTVYHARDGSKQRKKIRLFVTKYLEWDIILAPRHFWAFRSQINSYNGAIKVARQSRAYYDAFPEVTSVKGTSLTNYLLIDIVIPPHGNAVADIKLVKPTKETISGTLSSCQKINRTYPEENLVIYTLGELEKENLVVPIYVENHGEEPISMARGEELTIGLTPEQTKVVDPQEVLQEQLEKTIAQIEKRQQQESYQGEGEVGYVVNLHENVSSRARKEVNAVMTLLDIADAPAPLKSDEGVKEQELTEAELRQAFEKEIDVGQELTTDQKQELLQALIRVKAVFATGVTAAPTASPGVEHVIEIIPGVKPIRQKAYTLSPEKAKFAVETIANLEKNKCIKASHSEWASPIVIVPKAGEPGKWRLVIDYRRLNAVTRKDAYPIPRIDQCLEMCRDADWMSVVDVKDAYHHIKMAKESQKYTAFLTPRGLFEWVVMPLGLCNAPATWQRHIDNVMRPFVAKGGVAYFDDIIIATKGTFSEHVKRVQEILNTLKEYGLEVKPKKCHFAVRKVKILGHIINQGKIEPDPEKVKAIAEYPPPTNIRALRAFLGLLNYYRTFIQNFAVICAPLHALTSSKREFIWAQEHELAFKQAKDALAKTTGLFAPDFTKPFILQTDASDVGISAILAQVHDGKEVPIAFASKHLNTAEQNYSTTEKECLAILYGCQQFERYLSDREFLIVTDHSALQWLMNSRGNNKRLMRWALALQELSFKIVHRKGKVNVNADALSRYPVDPPDDRINEAVPPPPKKLRTADRTELGIVAATSETPKVIQPLPTLDFDEFVEEQRRDPEYRDLYAYLETNRASIPAEKSPTELQQFKKKASHYVLHPVTRALMWYSVKMARATDVIHSTFLRLVVPSKFRKHIIAFYHDSPHGGHAGMQRTYQRIRLDYHWNDMFNDVCRHISACKSCQELKTVYSAVKSKAHLTPATAPMEVMSLDVKHMTSTPSGEFKYILAAIDHFTKYAVAVPLKTVDETTVSTAFLNLICYTLGTPKRIITDNGPEFQNLGFSSLCRQAGIQRVSIPAHHPESNGQVERFIHTLSDILRTVTAMDADNWAYRLPAAIYAYNSTPNEQTTFSPFFLMFGREPRSPGDLQGPTEVEEVNEHTWSSFLLNQMKDAHRFTQEMMIERLKSLHGQHPAIRTIPTFFEGEIVYAFTPSALRGIDPQPINNVRTPRLTGPYVVLGKRGKYIYEVRPVQNPHAKSEFMHISRLKRFQREDTGRGEEFPEKTVDEEEKESSPPIQNIPTHSKHSGHRQRMNKARLTGRNQVGQRLPLPKPQLKVRDAAEDNKPATVIFDNVSSTANPLRPYSLRNRALLGPPSGTYSDTINQTLITPEQSAAYLQAATTSVRQKEPNA